MGRFHGHTYKPPLRDDGDGIVEWILSHPDLSKVPSTMLARSYAAVIEGKQRHHAKRDDLRRAIAQIMVGRGLFYKEPDVSWAGTWGKLGRKQKSRRRAIDLTNRELDALGLGHLRVGAGPAAPSFGGKAESTARKLVLEMEGHARPYAAGRVDLETRFHTHEERFWREVLAAIGSLGY